MAAPVGGGTGSSLARAIIITSGVSALVSSLLSFVKNYRKPLLQRYVVRILLMLVLGGSLEPSGVKEKNKADQVQGANLCSIIMDWYCITEGSSLLINFLGGERALIIMAHGRPPVSHAWPLNHVLPKLDISDPHTFLAVKRGILQYAWLKPILAIASIVMKATGTYEEGYLSLSSGYLWTGIVYNLSVTVSLYSLAMFWVCLHNDLTPFRPVPKFLCVKLIIFASYWQGFFLSILQWLGALGNVAGYTPDNLAAAIQDALICYEMPIFAASHWYAFSWHDYADPTISAARLPVKYAVRDAFGPLDLIEDTKMTLRGENYEYRLFDSGDNIIAHEESHSRVKRVMDGMRYERGGKAKYWIPKPGEASKAVEANIRTPLLTGGDSSTRSRSDRGSRSSTERYRSYSEIEVTLDDEDEQIFNQARALEFGDWNYPVITANEVPRDQRLPTHRSYQSSRTGGDVKKSRSHRKRLASGSEGRRDQNNASSRKSSKSSGPPRPLQRNASSTSSHHSHRSQLVDLVVEDHEAEEEDRDQAQRELGSAWAGDETRRFLRPSGQPIEEEAEPEAPIREVPAEPVHQAEEEEDRSPSRWAYGALEEEDNVWGK
ncbi:Transmembrane protein 184-like protein [Penicillium subrubescens]|uniref:Transmembrane protein 184-like protein n=1 Tax=Penicillium subrubescens TaxID=1316194 RepID=A0A1Q5UKM4_9EURO|nr:Transmembrane protein 184-like protein [Penicillium subrubescens]